jgi:hypothetical protein
MSNDALVSPPGTLYSCTGTHCPPLCPPLCPGLSGGPVERTFVGLLLGFAVLWVLIRNVFRLW